MAAYDINFQSEVMTEFRIKSQRTAKKITVIIDEHFQEVANRARKSYKAQVEADKARKASIEKIRETSRLLEKAISNLRAVDHEALAIFESESDKNQDGHGLAVTLAVQQIGGLMKAKDDINEYLELADSGYVAPSVRCQSIQGAEFDGGDVSWSSKHYKIKGKKEFREINEFVVYSLASEWERIFREPPAITSNETPFNSMCKNLVNIEFETIKDYLRNK